MKLPYWVDRIGIELEGLFPSNYARVEGTWHYDGSVYFSSSELRDTLGEGPRPGRDDRDAWGEIEEWTDEDNNSYLAGEMVSRPCSTWDEFEDFVEEYFPALTNATCGTHVHVSFKKEGHLAAFAAHEQDIKEDLRSVYLRWAKENLHRTTYSYLRNRVNGDNNYCRAGDTSPELFYKHDTHDLLYQEAGRYSIINFHALNKHGTVEIRVLPGFITSKECLAAVRELLNIVTKYVRKFNQKRFRKVYQFRNKKGLEAVTIRNLRNVDRFDVSQLQYTRGYVDDGMNSLVRYAQEGAVDERLISATSLHNLDLNYYRGGGV